MNKKHPTVAGHRMFCGGDEGDRTPYLLNAIQALSQVSYAPTFSVPSSRFLMPFGRVQIGVFVWGWVRG